MQVDSPNSNKISRVIFWREEELTANTAKSDSIPASSAGNFQLPKFLRKNIFGISRKIPHIVVKSEIKSLSYLGGIAAFCT